MKEDGKFSFKQRRPESPDFYRLRIENQILNFSIDSIETIKIKADYANFSTGYEVEDSPNSAKIKELTLKQLKLQESVNALVKASQSGQLEMKLFEDSLSNLIESYKNDVKINYIYAAPNTAAAYFALFQKLNGYLIFDPLNSKEDVKCFAAVATSLNNLYPHADRSRNLYNIAIKGMRNTRTPRQKVLDMSQNEIQEVGIIDINLKDKKGNEHKLSELKGKVVLLDFIIYQSAVSTSHNFMLRDLYNKYAGSGFEIYQVSLDADEHFWKTVTDNLPWICVRDRNGIYSNITNLYNVKQVPAYFLINRNNELKGRDETISDLENAVKSLL